MLKLYRIFDYYTITKKRHVKPIELLRTKFHSCCCSLNKTFFVILDPLEFLALFGIWTLKFYKK